MTHPTNIERLDAAVERAEEACREAHCLILGRRIAFAAEADPVKPGHVRINASTDIDGVTTSTYLAMPATSVLGVYSLLAVLDSVVLSLLNHYRHGAYFVAHRNDVPQRETAS